MEYDGSGRLTSVCEVTTLPGSGTCGQTNSKTGYWTAYQYDVLGDLTKATVNYQAFGTGWEQPRTFTYDGLGRMKSDSYPESGTTTYTYDTDGTCGSSAGDKVRRYDQAGNVSCYHYDALHRLTQITYPSGPNTGSMPIKNFFYDLDNWNYPISHPKGRLIGTQTVVSGQASQSLEVFSYDAKGRVADYYQLSKNSGGWYHIQQNYFANDVVHYLKGFNNSGAALSHGFDYGLDGEGRTTSLWDEDRLGGTSVWCCTTYNAADQPDKVQVGRTVETFQYSSYTNRMTQWAGPGQHLADWDPYLEHEWHPGSDKYYRQFEFVGHPELHL
jgi:hypothetical protein